MSAYGTLRKSGLFATVRPAVDPTSGRDGALAIKGINTELWRWLKSRAALEGKTIGEFLNELIARYRAEVESTGLWLREPVRPHYPHGELRNYLKT